jgi:hypothetical protein
MTTEKPLEVGDEITSTPITECESCPEIVLKIRFLNEKWQDLHTLMKRMGGKEYAAYLLGEIQEDGIPYVYDYYIPEQEVTSVEADISEVVIPQDLQDQRIGWLHSHHSMGAFHSGRDEMSMNYPLNIVISTTGHVATYRHPATCGRIIRSKVEIVLMEPDRSIPGEEKIKQKQFQYNPPPQFPINAMSREGWDGWGEYEKEPGPINYTKREYARLIRIAKKQRLNKIGME